jgi:hypothetical protein
MDSNEIGRRVTSSALSDTSARIPWTAAAGFEPDPSRPELNAAIYACMEAFRLMTAKGGDEIETSSLGAFGASLHACTLNEVNAYTTKFRAFTDAMPAKSARDP